MSVLRLQAQKEIPTVTAKDLFEEALPKTFEAMKQQAQAIKATFVVKVFGKDGGAWFIEPKTATVRRAKKKEKSSCLLEMGAREFAALTAGKLDARAAMLAGRMRLKGNPDHLVALGAFLGG